MKKDLWNELARRARTVSTPEELLPFGFESAVLRRLAQNPGENLIEAWFPFIRPALGFAFATAILCVILQFRVERETAPNLLVETDNLIQLAVLK